MKDLMTTGAIALLLAGPAVATETERFSCENFASYDRYELDYKVGSTSKAGLTLTKITSSKEQLTKQEVAMIQNAVTTINLGQPYTPEQAINSFFALDDWDSDRFFTAEAGDIFYYQRPGLDQDQFYITTVTYPGDNEYGSVYGVDGPSIRLLGHVFDSDIYCFDLIDPSR